LDENGEQQLFCVCKQPYDPRRFMIGHALRFAIAPSTFSFACRLLISVCGLWVQV
jgi:hypothetical protein